MEHILFFVAFDENSYIHVCTPFISFSAKNGALLVQLVLHQRTAFCLQPVKHMRLCHRVRNFLLMCLHPVLQHQSKWPYDGLSYDYFILFFFWIIHATCSSISYL